MGTDLVAEYLHHALVMRSEDPTEADYDHSLGLWDQMSEEQRAECRQRSGDLMEYNRRQAEWALSTSTEPTSPTAGGPVSN